MYINILNQKKIKSIVFDNNAKNFFNAIKEQEVTYWNKHLLIEKVDEPLNFRDIDTICVPEIDGKNLLKKQVKITDISSAKMDVITTDNYKYLKNNIVIQLTQQSPMNYYDTNSFISLADVKKTMKCVCGDNYKEGGCRQNEDVISKSYIAIDLDEIQSQQQINQIKDTLTALDYQFLIYPTISWSVNNLRYRLFIKSTEYKDIDKNLAKEYFEKLLNVPVDASCFVMSQAQGLPVLFENYKNLYSYYNYSEFIGKNLFDVSSISPSSTQAIKKVDPLDDPQKMMDLYMSLSGGKKVKQTAPHKSTTTTTTNKEHNLTIDMDDSQEVKDSEKYIKTLDSFKEEIIKIKEKYGDESLINNLYNYSESIGNDKVNTNRDIWLPKTRIIQLLYAVKEITFEDMCLFLTLTSNIENEYTSEDQLKSLFSTTDEDKIFNALSKVKSISIRKDLLTSLYKSKVIRKTGLIKKDDYICVPIIINSLIGKKNVVMRKSIFCPYQLETTIMQHCSTTIEKEDGELKHKTTFETKNFEKIEKSNSICCFDNIKFSDGTNKFFSIIDYDVTDIEKSFKAITKIKIDKKLFTTETGFLELDVNSADGINNYISRIKEKYGEYVGNYVLYFLTIIYGKKTNREKKIYQIISYNITKNKNDITKYEYFVGCYNNEGGFNFYSNMQDGSSFFSYSKSQIMQIINNFSVLGVKNDLFLPGIKNLSSSNTTEKEYTYTFYKKTTIFDLLTKNIYYTISDVINIKNKFGEYTEQNREYFNICPFFDYKKVDITEEGKRRIKVFESFIREVVCDGVEDKKTFFINHLASILQDPIRNKYDTQLSTIFLSKQQGTGKSTLMGIISNLVNNEYSKMNNYSINFNNIDVLQSQFYGSFIENKIIVNFEEIKAFSEQTYNFVKSLISQNDIVVEQKGKQPYKAVNISNYFFCSNSDIMYLGAKEDRRFTVYNFNSKWGSVMNPDPAYAEQIQILNDFFKGKFINELRTYLLDYNVDVSLLKHCYFDNVKINNTNFEKHYVDKLEETDIVNNFNVEELGNNIDQTTVQYETIKKLYLERQVSKKIGEQIKYYSDHNIFKFNNEQTHYFNNYYSLVSLTSFKKILEKNYNIKISIKNIKEWAMSKKTDWLKDDRNGLIVTSNNKFFILVSNGYNADKDKLEEIKELSKEIEEEEEEIINNKGE